MIDYPSLHTHIGINKNYNENAWHSISLIRCVHKSYQTPPDAKCQPSPLHIWLRCSSIDEHDHQPMSKPHFFVRVYLFTMQWLSKSSRQTEWSQSDRVQTTVSGRGLVSLVDGYLMVHAFSSFIRHSKNAGLVAYLLCDNKIFALSRFKENWFWIQKPSFIKTKSFLNKWRANIFFSSFMLTLNNVFKIKGGHFDINFNTDCSIKTNRFQSQLSNSLIVIYETSRINWNNPTRIILNFCSEYQAVRFHTYAFPKVWENLY